MESISFILFKTQAEARKAFFEMKQVVENRLNTYRINELCVVTPTEEIYFISEHTANKLQGTRPSRIAIHSDVSANIVAEYIAPLQAEISYFSDLYQKHKELT